MFRNRPAGHNTGGGSSGAATAIQGTIRPPPPSSGSTAGGPAAVEYTRQQHLESYLQDETLSKSTRKVSADDSTYDTVFQTVDHWTLIVRVHLPPPSSASSRYVPSPQMTLAGIKARHNWLDAKMRVVGYRPISSDSNWREARILLGTAVLQVIQHLQLHPPDVLEVVDRGLQSIQRRGLPGNSSSSTGGGGGSANSSSRTTSPVRPATAAAPPGPPAPDYDSVFAVDSNHPAAVATSKAPPPFVPPLPAQSLRSYVDPLESSAVQDLLEDEIAFLQYCNSLEYTQTLAALVESALDRNHKVAESNLTRKPELERLREEVESLEGQLHVRFEEYSALKARQDEICRPPPVTEIRKVLTKVKRIAFDESERMAEEWEGDGDPAAFFQEFVQIRKVHHQRAAKLELLLHQQSQEAGGDS